MKQSLILFLACFIFAAPAESAEPFAVVELYTSEGCSSCPPADAFLVNLTDEALKNNARIYTLGFHVDYWNDLGWKDEYSSAAYSQRQREYARKLNKRNVYTPQMIVNGNYEFNGARRDLAQLYIEEEFKRDFSTLLEVNVTKEGSRINIQYNVSPANEARNIHMALVENNISNSIHKGENSGRVLKHANVVRAFKSIPLKKNSGKAVLSIPADLKEADAFVTVYVQNETTMEVLAATQHPLN